MKNKICVIFTGGTIGSYASGNTVDLTVENKAALIEEYKKRYGGEVKFDVLRPLDILSENIQFTDLDAMAACLRAVNKSKYDGIILTHGTDTLSFTATLFSQIFCDVPIPVVFVSALYPLNDSRSKGVENFAGAVSFIENEGLSGVFVSFTNDNENLQIHLASRITVAEQISGNFSSVMGAPLCELVDGKFVYSESPYLPKKEEISKPRQPYGRYSLCKDIVTIRARSFLDFSYYNFGQKKPRAVIIELYHSGTICTAGEETNVLKFIDYCGKLGISVILSPVDSKARVYASAFELKDKCILAYDTSFEMTVIKVMLALGEDKDIETELKKNNFFEKIHGE